MWREYNPNPCGRSVGDCAIRATSIALGIGWEEAYMVLANAGLLMCDLPNSNSTISAVLRQHGFYRSAISNECPDCYTVTDFCSDHPVGTYVLGVSGHVVAIIDGDYYDSWDSGNEIPMFYFYRPEGR